MTTPTPAQTAARLRNWRIRNLRGLWAQAHQLDGDLAAQVRVLVDEQLAREGAETQAQRAAWAEAGIT